MRQVEVRFRGKTITYSGDTEWCESLLSAAARADLFIAEAYTHEKPVRFHLDFKIIKEIRRRWPPGAWC